MLTFGEVRAWLNLFDPSHLRQASLDVLQKLRNALESGNISETNGMLKQVKDYACSLRDEMEVTELLVECAAVADKVGEADEARQILLDTVSRAWSDLHRRAVIEWLLGTVQWSAQPGKSLVIVSWRNSLSDFEKLSRMVSLSGAERDWYARTCRTLENELEQAIRETTLTPESIKETSRIESVPKDASAEQASISFPPRGTTETQASAESVPGETNETLSTDKDLERILKLAAPSDILQLFSISEEIPCGDFGPSGMDPFPVGQVEVERVTINGHAYRIRSTRGRKIISLSPDQKYTVVKVKGDSMNLEDISDRDFVLLRRVESPNNGDIVMAEVVGTDSHATLKKFFKEKDQITLKPHSSNPLHQPFVFTNMNEGFFIRGVVIAVLKPVD